MVQTLIQFVVGGAVILVAIDFVIFAVLFLLLRRLPLPDDHVDLPTDECE